MHHFAVQIYYNDDYGSSLIFVCWMYETGVALVVHEQRVRCLYCFVCSLELEWKVYWRLMQYIEAIISPSYAVSMSTYTTMMAMTTICWSSFVELMERVLCGSCTNRPYVCIAACVLEFDGVIDVRCSMWSQCHSHHIHTLQWQWQWRLCVDLRLLNLWNNWCRVGPKPTASTFVLLYVLELEGACY